MPRRTCGGDLVGSQGQRAPAQPASRTRRSELSARAAEGASLPPGGVIYDAGGTITPSATWDAALGASAPARPPRCPPHPARRIKIAGRAIKGRGKGAETFLSVSINSEGENK